MNPPSLSLLAFAAALGLSGGIMAQTPSVTHLSSPVRLPGTWANAPSEEDLQELGTLINIGRRTMGIAVENLEQLYFEKYAKTGLVDFQMPKLIYGPGARDAVIDGDLRLSLYNMRAVDAVALVAAAAGCKLEPIPAPPESPDDKKNPQRAVGYYVTVAMRPPTMQVSDIAPDVKPLPPGVAIPMTLPPLPPPPPALKVVEPVVDHFIYTNVSATPAPADPAVPSARPPLAPAGSFVRIYPMGFFLRGTENDEEYAKKHLSLEQLVKDTLEQAKLDDKEEPMLSLHSATKILIVKASAAQHELIQQIVTSLKENAQAGTQETATLPR